QSVVGQPAHRAARRRPAGLFDPARRAVRLGLVPEPHGRDHRMVGLCDHVLEPAGAELCGVDGGQPHPARAQPSRLVTPDVPGLSAGPPRGDPRAALMRHDVRPARGAGRTVGAAYIATLPVSSNDLRLDRICGQPWEIIAMVREFATGMVCVTVSLLASPAGATSNRQRPYPSALASGSSS